MNSLTAIVGSDDAAFGAAVRELLVQAGIACDFRSVLPLELLVDRAILERPYIVVLRQPDSLAETVSLVREVCAAGVACAVAIGPAEDSRRIMSVMQAGAQEYVDEGIWQTALREALIRIRVRHDAMTRSRESARIISVVGASGGAGATLVAANVATALANQHGPLLLMDLRLEAGDLNAFLDVDPQFTLADLCENIDRLDESVFEQLLTPHPSGVQLLAAPGDFEAQSTITAKGFRRALALGRWRYPYIVMDLGCLHYQIQQEAAVQSDIVAVVLRLDFPSIRNARRLAERLAVLGVDPSRIRYVVNRYGEARQMAPSHAQEALGAKLHAFLPDEPATVNMAINAGQPVVTCKPRSRLSKRLLELSTSLNGRHVE
jgi:pilus assembly protein CpaE